MTRPFSYTEVRTERLPTRRRWVYDERNGVIPTCSAMIERHTGNSTSSDRMSMEEAGLITSCEGEVDGIPRMSGTPSAVLAMMASMKV